MRDSLALLAVLFLIALFFLPAYYIGPLYLLLVVIYLLALYAVEKRGLGKTVERILDALFFMLIMCFILKKLGEPLWQGLALGLLLLGLEAAKGLWRRRSRDKGYGF